MIRRALTGFAVALVLVVVATLTSATEAHAQARASLNATARVVDAGPGWAAHLAGVERAVASGQVAAGEVRMTESGLTSLTSRELPRPVVLVTRTAVENPRNVTIYVQHVAN
ncbi:MAG: hypothetical protein ACREMJ_03840 [Gemmatimonadales bacterium]